MVKVGDKVRVDGREVRVTSSWGQGKHRVYALDDNTTVLDLDQKVQSGEAEIIPEQVVKPKPFRMRSEKYDTED
jgi:hypothetical protein